MRRILAPAGLVVLGAAADSDLDSPDVRVRVNAAREELYKELGPRLVLGAEKAEFVRHRVAAECETLWHYPYRSFGATEELPVLVLWEIGAHGGDGTFELLLGGLGGNASHDTPPLPCAVFVVSQTADEAEQLVANKSMARAAVARGDAGRKGPVAEVLRVSTVEELATWPRRCATGAGLGELGKLVCRHIDDTGHDYEDEGRRAAHLAFYDFEEAVSLEDCVEQMETIERHVGGWADTVVVDNLYAKKKKLAPVVAHLTDKYALMIHTDVGRPYQDQIGAFAGRRFTLRETYDYETRQSSRDAGPRRRQRYDRRAEAMQSMKAHAHYKRLYDSPLRPDYPGQELPVLSHAEDATEL